MVSGFAWAICILSIQILRQDGIVSVKGLLAYSMKISEVLSTKEFCVFDGSEHLHSLHFMFKIINQIPHQNHQGPS